MGSQPVTLARLLISLYAIVLHPKPCLPLLWLLFSIRRTSKGGEALGPEKASCPSIGEYQDTEGELGGLVSRGRRGWDRVFSEGKPRKGENI